MEHSENRWSPGFQMGRASVREGDWSSDVCSSDLKLWDAHAGTVIREWTDGPEFLYNIAFSRDGKSMVACGSSYTAPHDTALALWDVNGGQRVWSIPRTGGVRGFRWEERR